LQEFTANADGNSVVVQVFNITQARFLRIHPKKWHTMACMRIELYGCTGKIVDNNMTIEIKL